MKTWRISLVFCMMSGISGYASAASLDTIENLDQAQFAEFSKSISAATHYRSVAPSEPLGTLGFDIGLGVSSTDISGNLFDLASNGSFDGSDLVVAKLQVQKGLPFGLDIGASLSSIPDSDATIFGGELRYAIVDGGVLTPSLGIRASYSQLQGLDDLDLQSSALELGISKGILFFTPYAGVGVVRTTADPQNIDGLRTEKFDENKVFIGITANFGFAVTLEADRTGDIRTYSAKAGIRF
ncbi:MAG: hypothetical protein AB8B87_27080 [Granulosicoccus sp.]